MRTKTKGGRPSGNNLAWKALYTQNNTLTIDLSEENMDDH